MTTSTTQDLAREIAALSRTAPAGGKVLSVYLDTPRQHAERRPYATAFRKGCLELRAALGEREAEAFDVASAHVARYLTEEFAAGSPGLAVFAASDTGYFHTFALPEPPGDEIAWERRPRLAPLLEMLDSLGRTAVALVDQRRARLFTILLGEIESRAEINDDVPGRSSASGWYSLAQTRIARHQEQQVLRHLQRTADALLALFRERPFDRLLLAGPEESLSLFRHHLPRPLAALMAEDLRLDTVADEPEVLNAALAAAERSAQAAAEQAVLALLEAGGSAAVALGAEATLRAVNDGRVHRLFLTKEPDLPGAVCAGCGRLALAGANCPVCASPLATTPDLRPAILERTRRQGARAVLVHGAAAERLARYDGLGAWTRYAD